MSSLFGWDLLYSSIQTDVKNDQDVLVCFTHLVLVSNGFKCIGLGDSKNMDGTETKTETLPRGWNSSNDNYAIRYVYEGRLYNLKATNMDDAIMVNLIRVHERTVSMVQLNIRAVMQRCGFLEQMIPNAEELKQTIKKQLIDKVAVSTKYKDDATQTSATRLAEETSHSTPSFPIQPERDPLRVPLRTDPFGVGRNDLDPFGGLASEPGRSPLGILPPIGGGGGMLFVPPRGPRLDPFGPNLGIAPGSIPPGARFDPFRPPDVDRNPRLRPRSDNDDLLPPGFDDMYM